RSGDGHLPETRFARRRRLRAAPVEERAGRARLVRGAETVHSRRASDRALLCRGDEPLHPEPLSARPMIELGAPAMVTWQLTRDCNLACVHCCTDSAPGRALPNELSRIEALRIADELIAAEVPKVMIVGGEPTIVPHFFELAERLGRGGVLLKIETNGQNFGPAEAARLKALPIFSIQISLDGDTEAVYGKMRPGGKLALAHRACRAVVDTGLPLEI